MNRILVFIALVATARLATAGDHDRIVLENSFIRYTIATNGQNIGFTELASGIDYLRREAGSACAMVRQKGREHRATSATFSNGRLVLDFADAGATAVLRIESWPSWICFSVESLAGSEIESLEFLNVPLTLEAKPEEAFAACALALNLITRVDQLPVLQTELRASAHQKFGVAGAKAALIGLPRARVLPALKELLSDTGAMPLCKVGGPWAQEVPFNHGSYLFNFGSLTESNVADWVEMTRSLGFTQIDNHGGGSFFRFGDFELNHDKWPEGWETYRRLVARLHAAGVGSIFHTYAFFIDKRSKYVTPVPDKRLDAFRTFTLAADVGPDSETIAVEESTDGMSTITGFFEHNSVLLHLGDELIAFGGVSQQPPWRFTAVKRGALGTKAAAHEKGTVARHLKECFGLLVPNPESSLVTEIAANHAQVVNECDFDGIYLDAIDGSSILRGGDDSWYWASKFVMEIQQRLKKPVGMEMSAMWHHFWQYRTRWQAWDYPQRGHKQFIDLHAQGVNGNLLLPLHLGWWSFQSFNPPQVEPTYPDVMECLAARLVGWDAGISLTAGVDREQLQKVPLFRRAAETLRACEELRHAGTIDEVTKAKLREPGSEFSLSTDASGTRRFRRSHAEAHTASLAEPSSREWVLTNRFPEQPLVVRIEALMSAGSPIDPEAVTIGDLAEVNNAGWTDRKAEGVTAQVVAAFPANGSTTAIITATNGGKVERRAAWVSYGKTFQPTLNLKEREALGLWIEGDGQGEVIGIRLESPQHLAFGAVADRYVTVDFTGKRWFSLIETESARWSDYIWNDGKGLYNLYRETIDFGVVESMKVWCQNLPPGRPVRCGLGPVKALRMLPGIMKDPVIGVNDFAITFPCELKSGSWIEYNGSTNFMVYGAKGEVLATVTPLVSAPRVRTGSNQVTFSCSATNGPSPRARVTVFAFGEQL